MAAPGEAAARYDSSAGDLSSPPSGSLSDPDTPSRRALGREIVVGAASRQKQPPADFQHYHHDADGERESPQFEHYVVETAASGQQKKYGVTSGGDKVLLTAAGVPRKKPGRKPGTQVKPKTGDDGPDLSQPPPPPPKPRKPRKPRDADAPLPPRKRKIAPADDDRDAASAHHFAPSRSGSVAAASPPPHHSSLRNPSALSPSQQRQQNHPDRQPHGHGPHPYSSVPEPRYSPKMPKREAYPSSMQSILNSDPPPQPRSPTSSAVPLRSSGQSYDPIRGNYDPVRQTMVSHASYPSSPRASAQQPLNRSPSIASLIDANGPSSTSPHQPRSHQHPSASSQSRLQTHDPSSKPASPSPRPRPSSHPSGWPTAASEPKKEAAAAAPTPPPLKPVIKESNFTTIADGPVRKATDKQKTSTNGSTPLTDNLDDFPQDGEGRSILDFGKARPGEETQVPSIILNIPISVGETNKYVNFMRMAEEQYGWDALHPRLAANRDRKARIAAAAASLEKVESGRESGDEMSVDLSDVEGSNQENGGTSGPDAQAKPKKKRTFKEDQYDVDDDFVDDSELLWEAQAAASRDGFFVYSGPLVPEPEKPEAGHEDRPKRGRGGRGGRGAGRGASTRGGSGPGRGSGAAGSRGGSIARKPRVTKLEKAQRDREKAEREEATRVGKASLNGHGNRPSTPSFAVSELSA